MTNDTENTANRDKNEKRNWFHSLSRRKKSSAAAASSALACSQESAAEDGTNNQNHSGKERKRKDERKNVFQRFKKRVGIHFSIRRKKTNTETMPSNANGQHIEEAVSYPNDLLPLPVPALNLDPPEMIPFTQNYRRFVTKKWSENGLRPNRVMYTACSEMLSQVWYWGEISRHDAQRQLKDKPIGSFLVRDSEAGGSSICWYTLSFRIPNCTLHYRLENQGNYWQFEEFQYESIVDMIEDIVDRCTKDNFVCFVRAPNELQPPLPVVLKYPVSRYNKIMDLQDLCRRVIQQYVSVEDIQELQIPTKLHEYLSETRELVFQSSSFD